MNCCQATHPFLCGLMGSYEEPPDDKQWAAMRHIPITPNFWVLSWTAWRWWITAKWRESNGSIVVVLRVLGEWQTEIEKVSTVHWSLDSINWEIILLLESIRGNCYDHSIRVRKFGNSDTMRIMGGSIALEIVDQCD